jgi:hypothetical protein
MMGTRSTPTTPATGRTRAAVARRLAALESAAAWRLLDQAERQCAALLEALSDEEVATFSRLSLCAIAAGRPGGPDGPAVPASEWERAVWERIHAAQERFAATVLAGADLCPDAAARRALLIASAQAWQRLLAQFQQRIWALRCQILLKAIPELPPEGAAWAAQRLREFGYRGPLPGEGSPGHPNSRSGEPGSAGGDSSSAGGRPGATPVVGAGGAAPQGGVERGGAW